jgi:hypothetical protein
MYSRFNRRRFRASHAGMIGCQKGGPEALADCPSQPHRVWNRISDVVREQIIDMALDCPELFAARAGGSVHG